MKMMLSFAFDRHDDLRVGCCCCRPRFCPCCCVWLEEKLHPRSSHHHHQLPWEQPSGSETPSPPPNSNSQSRPSAPNTSTDRYDTPHSPSHPHNNSQTPRSAPIPHCSDTVTSFPADTHLSPASQSPDSPLPGLLISQPASAGSTPARPKGSFHCRGILLSGGKLLRGRRHRRRRCVGK